MTVKELKQALEKVEEETTVCADSSFWNTEVNGWYMAPNGSLMLTSLFVQPRNNYGS